MRLISLINISISILFTIFYFHQFVYLIVPLFTKRKKVNVNDKENKFAVLIAARNEEKVITKLIESIRTQKYPKEQVSIFVVADNCTDQTAVLARSAGAIVYERFDKEKIGKGYALHFLLNQIFQSHNRNEFDGYFVFDADNLLDPMYIYEMNQMFNEGHPVITSYRNSKNYGTNWISAGYSLWFLRESAHMNRPRTLINTGCTVSGTGFLISKDIIIQENGWNFFLLTEDIEFSVYHAIQGNRIAYCHRAIFYDEQPTTFAQSWRQRMRWAKGFYQVFFKYGDKLFLNIFSKPSFWCYDLFVKIMPTRAIGAISLSINLILIVLYASQGNDVTAELNVIWRLLGTAYLINFGFGLITTLTEWKNIHCHSFLKVIYMFTFPIFIWTYTPISIVAIFTPVKWKPVHHTQSITIEDVLS